MQFRSENEYMNTHVVRKKGVLSVIGALKPNIQRRVIMHMNAHMHLILRK